MADYLKRLIEHEEDVRYRTPAMNGDAEFKHAPGRVPVLLSAPHGAAHTRNGRMKEEDEFTAAMVLLVSELTGAHALYARRYSHTDPNYYRDVPYKQYMAEIVRQHRIRFVIDVHGASERHGIGVALGTMEGKSCPAHYRRILGVLKEAGFDSQADCLQRLDVDHLFKGGGGLRQETITRYACQSLGVPSAQFELNPRLRVVQTMPFASYSKPFYGHPEMIRRTVDFFVQLVEAVQDSPPPAGSPPLSG